MEYHWPRIRLANKFGRYNMASYELKGVKVSCKLGRCFRCLKNTWACMWFAAAVAAAIVWFENFLCFRPWHQFCHAFTSRRVFHAFYLCMFDLCEGLKNDYEVFNRLTDWPTHRPVAYMLLMLFNWHNNRCQNNISTKLLWFFWFPFHATHTTPLWSDIDIDIDIEIYVKSIGI